MTSFVRPIKYAPIFVGQTEEGERIVLYNLVGHEDSLHIKRPDGELWALSPGAKVEMGFESTEAKLHISIQSPEWTGKATGTHRDLIEEEAIR